MEMRNLNHSEGGGSRGFIVFAEAARMVKPAQRAFDNPSPGKDFPLMRGAFFWNFHAHEQSPVHFPNKSPAIPVIRAEFQNCRPALERLDCRIDSGDRVMNVRGVNGNAKDIAHRIGYDMPFPSFRFFPPSYPRSSPEPSVFTLCESMIA